MSLGKGNSITLTIRNRSSVQLTIGRINVTGGTWRQGGGPDVGDVISTGSVRYYSNKTRSADKEVGFMLILTNQKGIDIGNVQCYNNGKDNCIAGGNIENCSVTPNAISTGKYHAEFEVVIRNVKA